jgi:hypothetical protein
LPPERGTAEPAQFAINQGNQLIPGSLIAVAPPFEEMGDIGLHDVPFESSLILPSAWQIGLASWDRDWLAPDIGNENRQYQKLAPAT